MFGNSNDESNFPLKLLLTNTKVSRIHKAFSNCLSAYTKLKTKFSLTGQSEAFLGSLLRPLLKTGLPIMKNILVIW